MGGREGAEGWEGGRIRRNKSVAWRSRSSITSSSTKTRTTTSTSAMRTIPRKQKKRNHELKDEDNNNTVNPQRHHLKRKRAQKPYLHRLLQLRILRDHRFQHRWVVRHLVHHLKRIRTFTAERTTCGTKKRKMLISSVPLAPIVQKAFHRVTADSTTVQFVVNGSYHFLLMVIIINIEKKKRSQISSKSPRSPQTPVPPPTPKPYLLHHGYIFNHLEHHGFIYSPPRATPSIYIYIYSSLRATP